MNIIVYLINNVLSSVLKIVSRWLKYQNGKLQLDCCLSSVLKMKYPLHYIIISTK